MFEVAPSEMLLFAIVAIVVIGPKDLPKAMRFVGKWVGKARGMARHFRSGIDTMIRESELEELEKQWRAQNEAIMRAHPHIDPALPSSSDGSPTTAFEGPAVEGPAQPSDSRITSAPGPATAPATATAAAPATGATEGEKG